MELYTLFLLIGGVLWVFLLLKGLKRKFANANVFINLADGDSPNIKNIAGFCILSAIVYYLPIHINAPFSDLELYIFTAICMLISVKFFFLNK